MIAFTLPGGKYAKCILLLKDGEALRIDDNRLDFSSNKTVVVKKDLYAFKEGSPVSAYKIADFTSTNHLVKTTLSNLPRNEYLCSFSICYWEAGSSIVLTGGSDDDFFKSAQTYRMAL